MPRKLSILQQSWPLAEVFTIARGSRTHAHVIQVTLQEGDAVGRGECVPYARYGESLESVINSIRSVQTALEAGLSKENLQGYLPAGAARNALDAALWDLESQITGQPVWHNAGLCEPDDAITAYTLSLQNAEAMGQAAAKQAHRPLLKIKLGQDGDTERLQAVRQHAPKSRLIVDANEGWTEDNLADNLEACLKAGVEMIEQPLPASADNCLKNVKSPIILCADESIHDTASLEHIVDRYQAINIKLDKTGGLTEAIKLLEEAQKAQLAIMIGCMVGTSLAMAPAFLLANQAKWVDLDAPLLLAEDHPDGFSFTGSTMHPTKNLWGTPRT